LRAKRYAITPHGAAIGSQAHGIDLTISKSCEVMDRPFRGFRKVDRRTRALVRDVTAGRCFSLNSVAPLRTIEASSEQVLQYPTAPFRVCRKRGRPPCSADLQIGSSRLFEPTEWRQTHRRDADATFRSHYSTGPFRALRLWRPEPRAAALRPSRNAHHALSPHCPTVPLRTNGVCGFRPGGRVPEGGGNFVPVQERPCILFASGP
jgi:hypothetical protein